jgi:DNA-binding transcriptional regulator YiaG
MEGDEAGRPLAPRKNGIAMSEGDAPAPHANKARRESLGLRESDVAALIGWSVNKIRDYESGKVPLSPADEERVAIAINSLAHRKPRR